MTSEIAIRDETALPTKQEVDTKIERATYIADQLAAIVRSRGWFADIQGKQYLEVEAWQFIGFHVDIASDIEYTTPLLGPDGEVIAYQSKAVLTRFGERYSSGVMECGMDSFPTRGKEGRDKHKAAQSAAQTWAISKAYRNRLSFIAKMAGFEPTPADEMRWEAPSGGSTTAPGDGPNVCPIHNTTWFKSGRMQEEAHVVDGESGPKGGKVWCNKSTVLRDLDDKLRVAAIGWEREALSEAVKAQHGKPWGQLTPTQKADAIKMLDDVREASEPARPQDESPAEDDPIPTNDNGGEEPHPATQAELT